jgi:cytidine deaminase
MKISEDQKQKLIKRAISVRENAYAPYSNYAVGSAALAGSGEVYDGANIENAAYPSSMCAERSAIFNAISNGEREIVAIAVVSENGGSPCGACRQVVSEFGKDALVIVVNARGEILLESGLEDLLPHSFGPGDLGIS